MKSRREAKELLLVTSIVFVASIIMAIVFDTMFVYGLTVISLYWLIKCIIYLAHDEGDASD